MERRGAVLALVSVMMVSACSKVSAPVPQASSSEPATASAGGIVKLAAPRAPSIGTPASSTLDDGVAERRIVRSAELGIEAGDPASAARAAGVIVDELGGYVASSDRSQRIGEDESTTTVVNMVLCVPSDRFTIALGRLEKLGSRTLEQQVRSDDVTEEVIDLRARLVAQRALESQFLEILRQVKSVKDALEVNTALAEVRTTIEKLEGRQRFLEKRVSTSTIKLSVEQSAPLLRTARFAFDQSLARAGADLLHVSAAILHGGIRMLGVLVPVLALVVLPGILSLRALLRRWRRAPAS